MTDLFLLACFGCFMLLGLRHPFVWVLVYLYVDIVAPQKAGWLIMPMLPVSLIAFAAAFGGWLLIDRKEGARFSFRQGLILALMLYCAMTTAMADFPVEAAEKWAWVWKALFFAMFLPLTLTTRLRLESAALIMVLSLATIVINGGIKTVLSGGGYGTLSLYVNENSGLFEGSIISCVSIASIPLALWLVKHGTIFPKDWRVKGFTAGLIFSALLIPIGTEARTGLICAGVLGGLVMRDAKNRFLYMGLASLAMVLAVPFLPESYTSRMSTIQTHESDQSASTRIAVWAWTIDYVKDHPLGGGFDAYRGNRLTFETKAAATTGSSTYVEAETMTDEGRAYHSSYFEMLGEQGYPGFALWAWLQLLGLWQMERIRRRWRAKERADQQWQAPLATALQHGQIIYLVGSLFVGIAFQPFIFMLIGLQCALWSYLRRMEELEEMNEPHAGRKGRKAGQKVSGLARMASRERHGTHGHAYQGHAYQALTRKMRDPSSGPLS